MHGGPHLCFDLEVVKRQIKLLGRGVTMAQMDFKRLLVDILKPKNDFLLTFLCLVVHRHQLQHFKYVL